MSKAEHIRPETWRALLEGRLPEDERAALRAHLEAPCETCEAVLAEAALEAGHLDPLDGPTDAALLAQRPAGWAADEVGAARLARALGAPRGRPGGRWAGAAAGLVLAAAAALFLVARLPAPDTTGAVHLKGPALAALPPRIELARVDTGGPVTPLAPGADPLARRGHLLIRFAVEHPVCGHLYLRSAGQTLYQASNLCLAEGAHTLSEDGEPLAIDLADASLGSEVCVRFEAPGTGPMERCVRLLRSE